MSNFPNQTDDDVSLPRVDDNITEIGAEAINSLRSAVFAIEDEIGIGASGTKGSIAARLAVSINPDGYVKPSILTGLGLVTLPITNAQISATAGIKETKLSLDYNTSSLFNLINNTNIGLNTALNFITNHGYKLEPHLSGNTFRHVLNHIDIDSNINNYFKNKSGLLRNNSNLYNLLNDINKDFVSHQKSDATSFGATDPTSSAVGTVPPINYAHVASGVYLNTSNFSFVPQTATDLQQFAQFIDNSNIFILGTRIQTLYQNGISRSSRSTIINDTNHGQLIVSPTTATTYLLAGGSSSPIDSIDNGDDIIEFFPAASNTTTNFFDAQFSLVKSGDIITINYGVISTSFLIKEVKYIVNGINKRYVVRISGKNFFATTTGIAQINKALFNTEKYGVLSLAQAQLTTPVANSNASLIVGSARGAEVLGNGFNPDLIDNAHYNLYLILYPTGNPADGSYPLPAIDISGNKGQTPGEYTLESIVEATNAAFRAPGYNYRFTAYSYQGNFGIMLADPYGGSSFSIAGGVLATNGFYDQNLSSTIYSLNVINVFDNKDALGFGPNNANIASPPYSSTFATTEIAQVPTKVFVPLTRKNFYVNGIERERFNIEPNQQIDNNGDGYWSSFIIAKQIIGSRLQITYQVNKDLSTSGLTIGKTIVVQSEGASNSQVDYGRFFIENIQFNSCNCDGYSNFTTITVYDGIHGTGSTPYASSAVGTNVRLYFSSDTVAFNNQNASDGSVLTNYKRHFEIYINQDGHTFAHERGRLSLSGSTQTINSIPIYSSSELININIYKISSKLRGYSYSNLKKINLQITSYVSTTGIFSGYLCAWDGSTISHQGPTIVGKKGQPVRFYDETNVDYIDFIFDINDTTPSISSTKNIDIQLFTTLSIDDEVMLLGTCQLNDVSKKITYLKDARQFGNVSEKQLSTSALDYISSSTRLLNENGIIRGFDITQIPSGMSPYSNTVSINGGTAIVNGKIIHMNNETIAIPVVQEITASTPNNTITWFVCVNDKGEFELVASTDFDPNGSFASLYTGLDHTRLFTVQNPNLTSTNYTIRGSYLSDIVQNQKDITIIGTITSTVDLVGLNYVITSSSSSDARRYVYNGYGGLDNPFILGQNASFRDFNSLNTWLQNLTKYKSSTLKDNNVGKKVIVKGNLNITSTISLDYLEEIIFEGDGGIFTISSDIGFSIGNNVKFKNIKFDYKYDPIISSDISFSTAFLSNPNKAAIFCNVGAAGNKNVSFENCIFTTSNQYHFGFIGFSFASAVCYLENVNIINNKFESTFAGDDKQNVISFIAPIISPTGTQLTGARLINCNISNNSCNKNQLILISAPQNVSSTTILDLITGINVRITGNICGAINVLVKKDINTNIFNTSFNLDKSNSTIISENICKFIYSGYSNGRMVDASNNRAISKINTGIFSGSLSIMNNACSFIHTGFRISTGYISLNPSLIIKDNKLTSYDSSPITGFLNDYYSGFTGSSFPQTATAIIADKIVGS